eukprot:TRINITY_DN49687_c0_g1_i1.p1 TRINITY_DN49687_c0_g1~~TRINITY_DN49687_c0_g1_i1.p1  ORF type:complete len:160 (+),score=25.55 TRINITY_DN49687_c0_g1_i1:66-545(+)
MFSVMASLEEIFGAYTAFGSGQQGSSDMDGRTWVKVCRDSNVFDKVFTQTDADLIFTKAKAGTRFATAKKVPFDIFANRLVPLAAQKKRISTEQFAQLLCPPAARATQAQYNKFHDDPTQYTGVHAAGGPSVVDKKISLQSIVQDHDALSCDVRGVVHR